MTKGENINCVSFLSSKLDQIHKSWFSLWLCLCLFEELRSVFQLKNAFSRTYAFITNGCSSFVENPQNRLTMCIFVKNFHNFHIEFDSEIYWIKLSCEKICQRKFFSIELQTKKEDSSVPWFKEKKIRVKKFIYRNENPC